MPGMRVKGPIKKSVPDKITRMRGRSSLKTGGMTSPLQPIPTSAGSAAASVAQQVTKFVGDTKNTLLKNKYVSDAYNGFYKRQAYGASATEAALGVGKVMAGDAHGGMMARGGAGYIGMGGGAVAGGAYGAYSDNTSILGGAMMGATLGAGAGFSAGKWGMPHANKVKNKASEFGNNVKSKFAKTASGSSAVNPGYKFTKSNYTPGVFGASLS